MTWSKIEWTDATWNPVTGCTKVSSGCLNCYAERMALRLQAMRNPNYKNGFSLTVHEHMLDRPLTWKDPRVVFVNSMSDLFHESVEESFIKRVFGVMLLAKQHTFQVLTKRAERLAALAPKLPWPKNIWMGVSVESADVSYRVDFLRKTPARIKFLSCEPLISSLGNLNLSGIDWVIVGGESGPGARPMREEWALEARDMCLASNVPFFFKQWGGVNKKAKGRLLENKLWDQMPSLS
jgi:protein gp37